MIKHGTVLFISDKVPSVFQGMIAGPIYDGGDLNGMAKFISNTGIILKIIGLVVYGKYAPYLHHCYVPSEMIDEYKLELKKFEISGFFKRKNHAWYKVGILLTNHQATMIRIAT